MKPRRAPWLDGGVMRIPLTRGLIATVDVEDACLGEFTWCAWPNKTGTYAGRKENRTRTSYLHRAVAARMGLSLDDDIDHRNGDRLDCRRINLRAATRTQNIANTGRPRTNTSGRKGVTWHKQNGKWEAQIKVNGRHVSLGLHESLDAAERAYKNAASAQYGEFFRG